MFTHCCQTSLQPFCNWSHSLCTIENCCEFVSTDLCNLRSHFMVLQFPLWSCSCGWVACGSQWEGCVCLQHIYCSTFCSLHSYSGLVKQVHRQGAAEKVISSKDTVKNNCNSFSVLLELLSFLLQFKISCMKNYQLCSIDLNCNNVLEDSLLKLRWKLSIFANVNGSSYWGCP